MLVPWCNHHGSVTAEDVRNLFARRTRCLQAVRLQLAQNQKEFQEWLKTQPFDDEEAAETTA